jgi:uncharacterized membrane protein YbhN (UPF0104 family)
MSSSSRWKKARITVGLAIAIASLVWSFDDVDPSALARAWRAAHLGWIALAVISVLGSVALIVWRWWLLLDKPVDPVRNELPFALLWHATISAQMANIIVPFRLGDAVRLVAAGHTLGLGPARAASAAILERLADVVALGVIGALLIFADVAPAWAEAALSKYAHFAVWIIIGGAVTLSAVAWISSRRVTAIPRKSALGLAAIASILVPLASALTNFLVARAFDLAVPPVTASLVLLVVLQTGTSIVAVPGALGVSQLLTVKTLEIWHVVPSEALAFAFALYVVARLPKLLFLPMAIAAIGRPSTSASVSTMTAVDPE